MIDHVIGHVNNVVYNRYAETGRVNWAMNFANMDTEHRDEWKATIAPTGIGMILRSIRTDYKFVSALTTGLKQSAVEGHA